MVGQGIQGKQRETKKPANNAHGNFFFFSFAMWEIWDGMGWDRIGFFLV